MGLILLSCLHTPGPVVQWPGPLIFDGLATQQTRLQGERQTAMQSMEPFESEHKTPVSQSWGPGC